MPQNFRFPRRAFDRGVAFVRERGRALDARRLDFTLGTGEATAVLAALAPYQNQDGGFGQAIEPDLRTPLSTAIGTSVGCQVLCAVGAPADHAIVRRAIDHLLATVDREAAVWPIITRKAVDAAPHAFWWDWTEDLAAHWNGFRYNPTAELLGYLHAYSTLVPAGVLDALTDALTHRLEDSPPENAFDFCCCLRLHDVRAIPPALRAGLADVLARALTKLDPESFHVNYMELAPGPDALLFPLVRDRFLSAVQRKVETQQEDGSWSPEWDWSAVDKQAWEQARIEWSGVLTRLVLEAVHRHGLVD